MVSHLPSKCKLLSSNPSTFNNNKQGSSVLNSIYLRGSKTHICRDPFGEDCDSCLRGLALAQTHYSWATRQRRDQMVVKLRDGLPSWIQCSHQSLTSVQSLGLGVIFCCYWYVWFNFFGGNKGV
jgi:hypothetical protein